MRSEVLLREQVFHYDVVEARLGSGRVMMTEDQKGEEACEPLTPVQKVAQRLKEDVPVGRLLHYMHAQSSVPQGIRDLVALASKLEEGSEVLMSLTHDGDGLLRTDPGMTVPGAADLVVTVRKLSKEVKAFLLNVRSVIDYLIQEG